MTVHKQFEIKYLKERLGRGTAWLILLVATMTLVIFIVTTLRYMSFLDLNWDLGINMQALWTNTHGYLMFETADYQTSGVLSFLEVNTAFIGIPISYLYYLVPSAPFLLFIQALVISSSAIPLYLFAEKHFSSWKLPLLITMVFLTNFAVLSGVFYDFHWESFLPLEFFSLVYFYSERKYRLSSLVILLGALTLEVFPFMAASFFLYALISPKEIIVGYKQPQAGKIRLVAIFLLLFSAAVYYILANVAGALLPSIMGNGYSTSGSAVHAVTYLLNFGINSLTFYNSLFYWLLLLVSLGFIPLFRWKSLAMVAPYFYWSVIAYPIYTAQFGIQYGIIAMMLLMVPFIGGLKEITARISKQEPRTLRALLLGPITLIILAFGFETSSVFVNHVHLIFFTAVFIILGLATILIYSSGLFSKKIVYGSSPVSRAKLLAYFLIVIIFVSFIIGPLNPANKSPPFTGGYAINYGVSPSYKYMSEIAEIVGHNNSVISTDNLFPFIANNPDAYSFFWYPANYNNNPNFPYNQYNLPKFLLLDTSQMNTVPAGLQYDAFHTNLYSERFVIENANYPGNIYLFQLGYQGSTTTYSV